MGKITRTQHGFIEDRDIGIVDPGDAGAIPVDQGSNTVRLTSTTAETRTLARPTDPGQEITLFMESYGGDVVTTVAGGLNYAGNNTITFSNQGESITLKGIPNSAASNRWQIVFNDINGAETDQSTGLTTV